jgi:hypothetical protein
VLEHIFACIEDRGTLQALNAASPLLRRLVLGSRRQLNLRETTYLGSTLEAARAVTARCQLWHGLRRLSLPYFNSDAAEVVLALLDAAARWVWCGAIRQAAQLPMHAYTCPCCAKLGRQPGKPLLSCCAKLQRLLCQHQHAPWEGRPPPLDTTSQPRLHHRHCPLLEQIEAQMSLEWNPQDPTWARVVARLLKPPLAMCPLSLRVTSQFFLDARFERRATAT